MTIQDLAPWERELLESATFETTAQTDAQESPLAYFPTYDGCPPFCDGHADMSALELHSTDLDYFTENGPVAVVQYGNNAAPLVALVDLESPAHLLTPARARQIAQALIEAADLADLHTTCEPDVEGAYKVLGAVLERGRQENERRAAESAAKPTVHTRHWSQGPFAFVEGLDAEVDVMPWPDYQAQQAAEPGTPAFIVQHGAVGHWQVVSVATGKSVDGIDYTSFETAAAERDMRNAEQAGGAR
jgi:hypothetical protein